MEGTGSNDVNSPHSTVAFVRNIKNPQTTMALTFLTHIISGIDGVQCSSILKLDQHFSLC